MSHVQDRARYEESDAAPRPIVLAGGALALLLGASLAVCAWIAGFLEREQALAGPQPHPMSAQRPVPEGPELQAVPADELRRHRAWEEEILGGTEWIDPVNRIVRIPIERALELSLAEGFPTRPGIPAEGPR